MTGFKKLKKLQVEELALLVAKEVESRDLLDILGVIHKKRSRSELFCVKDADVAFEKLLELSRSNKRFAEIELLGLNAPPRLAGGVSSTQIIWSQIFQVLVELNPVFSDEFSIQLISSCLTRRTHIGFAMCHSTVVAKLAENHTNLLDSSLLEIVIASTEDSRSIYALKLAKWLRDWPAIRSAALSAMVSRALPKQVEAMWLVNERGTTSEVLSFAEEMGISIPSSIKNSENIRAMTRRIVDSRPGGTSNGIAYAVRMDGSPMSQVEFRELSDIIQKDLEDGGGRCDH